MDCDLYHYKKINLQESSFLKKRLLGKGCVRHWKGKSDILLFAGLQAEQFKASLE